MKALAIASVNVKRLWRERSNIFFVFILPLGIIVIIGSLFGGGFQPRIGVAGAGDGALAADLFDRIEAAAGVDAVAYETRDELLLAVERGTSSAGVVIPGDYDQALSLGRPVEIGFVSRPDGSGVQLQTTVLAVVSEQSQLVRAALFSATQTGESFESALSRAASIEPGITPISVTRSSVGEALFPSSLGQFDLGASSQLLLFMFLTGLTGSAALIQTRNYGVSTRMLSTPTSSATVILGEALGRFGVVMIQGLYIAVVTLVAFGVDWGDPLAALAIMIAFAGVATGFTMLMGALFRNDEQAGGIGVVLGIGLAALGGAMVPIEFYSPQMRRVAHVTPHAWANDAFAELVRRDGTIADIVPELAVLTAAALVILTFSGWWLRRVLTH